jgi:hypothetical protein
MKPRHGLLLLLLLLLLGLCHVWLLLCRQPLLLWSHPLPLLLLLPLYQLLVGSSIIVCPCSLRLRLRLLLPQLLPQLLQFLLCLPPLQGLHHLVVGSSPLLLRLWAFCRCRALGTRARHLLLLSCTSSSSSSCWGAAKHLVQLPQFKGPVCLMQEPLHVGCCCCFSCTCCICACTFCCRATWQSRCGCQSCCICRWCPTRPPCCSWRKRCCCGRHLLHLRLHPALLLCLRLHPGERISELLLRVHGL